MKKLLAKLSPKRYLFWFILGECLLIAFLICIYSLFVKFQLLLLFLGIVSCIQAIGALVLSSFLEKETYVFPVREINPLFEFKVLKPVGIQLIKPSQKVVLRWEEITAMVAFKLARQQQDLVIFILVGHAERVFVVDTDIDVFGIEVERFPYYFRHLRWNWFWEFLEEKAEYVVLLGDDVELLAIFQGRLKEIAEDLGDRGWMELEV